MTEIGPESPSDPATSEPLDNEAATAELLEVPARAVDKVLVFVSYRINPDQTIAVALKRLIEGSIDPSPNAFVSGEGGLRPSEIGFKPQLQRAVQRAKAFVGLITPASREREWIYYEAGAAWGRGQMYAPVLVGTSPSDLTSSIADYQAVRAGNREEMRALITQLAAACGGVLKPHFSQRFQAFLRALEEHQKTHDETPTKSENESETPLWTALKLAWAGKKEEAATLFQHLEAEAASVEGKAEIRIMHLSSGKEAGAALVEKLEQIEAPYIDTIAYHYWIGLHEPRAATAVKHLRVVSDAKGSRFRGTALIELAKRLAQSGELDAATEILVRGLKDEQRHVRADAAVAWCELRDNDSAIVKLVIMHIGLGAQDDTRLLRMAASMALSEEWYALAVCLAQAFSSAAETGESMNALGRAYDRASLYSLAFKAYSKAADAGASVAKANMAALFSRAHVAAAGLKILEDHVGSFDSASPAYPFRIRSLLEDSLEQERAAEKQLADAGKRVRSLLGDFGDLLVSGGAVDVRSSTTYQRNGLVYKLAAMQDGFSLEAAEDETPQVLFRRFPSGLHAWSAWTEGTCVGLFSLEESGNLRGVMFNLASKASPSELVVYAAGTQAAAT